MRNPFRPFRAATLPHSSSTQPEAPSRPRTASRRSPLLRALAGLGLALGLAWVAPAQAAPDFTLTETVPASGDGTFTLANDSAGYSVSEVVVSGLGTYAGTTRAGWSAAAFFFDDPLGCQTGTGFSIGTGFCYALTDKSAGSAIGPGATETFTFDPAFTDPTPGPDLLRRIHRRRRRRRWPAWARRRPAAAPPRAVPEPSTWSLMALALLALAIGLRRRLPRQRAAPGRAGRRAAGLEPARPGGGHVHRDRLDDRRERRADPVHDLQGPRLRRARSGGRAQRDHPGHRARAEERERQGAVRRRRSSSPRRPARRTRAACWSTRCPTAAATRSRPARPSSPGAIYLQSGWQGDIESNCTTAYPCTPLTVPYTGIDAADRRCPSPTNPDGSAITGKVYGHIASATGSTAQMVIYTTPVPYKPLSLTDPTQSTLTRRRVADDRPASTARRRR